MFSGVLGLLGLFSCFMIGLMFLFCLCGVFCCQFVICFVVVAGLTFDFWFVDFIALGLRFVLFDCYLR